MPGDITLPMIAIAGGCLLLVLVLGIFWFAGRPIPRRLDARRTRFHAVVIDPRIAELGRAAFEDGPRPAREPVIEVVDIVLPPPPVCVPVMDYAALPPRMHSLPQPPRRIARGSTPAIVTAPSAHARHANDWDVPTAPSVTARMRTYRR